MQEGPAPEGGVAPDEEGEDLLLRRSLLQASPRWRTGFAKLGIWRKGVGMNKADLVAAVQKNLDESKAGAERAVNAVIDAIKTGVKKDKSVQVVGFGTFSIRKRAARKGRNPQTGETIKIKASKSVAFKPSKNFKDMV